MNQKPRAKACKEPILIEDLGVIFTPSMKEKRRYGIYLCSCGNEFKATTRSIKNKNTLSCGCYQKQRASEVVSTHRLSTHSLYQKWSGMKGRCYCKSDYHYQWYGERGISMDKGWKNDFYAFYKWCLNNGWDKNLEIDRIDNDGNYDPLNCRFVTKIENIRNARELIKTNTSGNRNIYILGNKYRVIVKGIHIGMYSNLEDAKQARNLHHDRNFA